MWALLSLGIQSLPRPSKRNLWKGFSVSQKDNRIMAKKNKMGYVYIFTNESFREGWVKIGKSQNIEKRLKELDNTSCPLPFDVYATLKTSRYDDAEDFVHDFISHFNQSLRIRPNREYFKVAPEEALSILYKVKKLMNEPDSEIIVYDEKGKKCAKQLEKKYIRHDDTPEETNYGQNDTEPGASVPRLSSLKTLKSYYRNLKSDLMKEILVTIGIDKSISEFTDIEKLKEINEGIKKYEKAHGIHHTHSCAVSKYIDYLQNGLFYDDLEYDAMLLGAKKEGYIQNHIEKEKVEKKKERRPPFKFSMIDLKRGDKIVFDSKGYEVIVASDNTIEYQGRTFSLTSFCKEFLPEEKRIPAGTYQGPLYFSYQGKTLDEIRKEREKA